MGEGEGRGGGHELCAGCGMTKITIGITRLWENLHRDDRIIELHLGPSIILEQPRKQFHNFIVLGEHRENKSARNTT